MDDIKSALMGDKEATKRLMMRGWTLLDAKSNYTISKRRKNASKNTQRRKIFSCRWREWRKIKDD